MALTPGQKRCVETLDRPLVVAAGAGSGKTYTLTQRIAGAVESGFVGGIDEVCAITFTNKAAAELKSRIKAELRSRGFADQALRVDEAWVSTIHGMCARILKAHALELGIDPAFRVAEGAEVSAYLDRAIDTVLSAEQEAASSPQVNALFDEYAARSYGGFGVSVESMLFDLVNAAASQANGADSFVMPEATMVPALAVEQAASCVECLLSAAECEKESAKRDDWMAAMGRALQDARGALSAGIADNAQALRLLSAFKLAKTFGSKGYKAKVDEARVVVAACTMEMRLGAAHGHLRTLAALARRVLDEFSALKRADGVLDNNDLLVLAARAIEDNPSIAEQYANKFKLVMVDEFQDTDQLQVDMIKRLAGEGAERLCTVGDAQQSIYRFRGADVSVYRRHLQSVCGAWPDSVIQLSDNFRSHGDVLAFVDSVFEKPDMFGGEFMSLSKGRDEAKVAAPFSEDEPRIVVQHTSRARGVANSMAAVTVAAERIADRFSALAAKGHAPGEMVVLLGRMSHADVYARALRDRGLPCVVSGGSVFARSAEAQAMLQLVRMLANPRETQALFNVLTSSLFALTAGDLLEVGGLAGFWRAAYDDADDHKAYSPQLNCALQVLSQARDSVGRVEVSHIMEQVVADSGWLSRMQEQGAEGLASAGNAFKAIRMVRGIERSGALGAASVARRFAQALFSSKEAPGALSVSGGDSVRIMTVHASKGLEFPIVAVADVKDAKSSASRLIVASVGGSVYVSLDLGRTLDAVGDTIDDAAMDRLRDDVLGLAVDEDELAAVIVEDAGAVRRRLALRAYLSVGDEEEANRLLYVALTRAKEALVVSSVGMQSKANPSGVPAGALSGVFSAFDAAGEGFAEGRSLHDFGGSQPAVLEHAVLKGDDALGKHDADGADSANGSNDADDGRRRGGTGGTGGTGGAGVTDDAGDSDGERKQFMVPVVESLREPTMEPYKPYREGVFSYSSISDASHEGDVLDRLARSYAISTDDSLGFNDDASILESSDAPVVAPFGTWDIRAADEHDMFWRPDASSDAFEDDFWDFDLAQAIDEDRATDLGTAFHRLAQYAVVARNGEGLLVMPPSARIDALCRTCNLDREQRMRLDAALARWFGCDVAHEMAALSDLAPEVPFFVSVPGEDGAHAYLEGEIDLLGFDATHTHATVVDYKTGGHDGETSGDLRRKHVLQAACYAYAIMLQGIEDVEAVFVRVERPCANDPAQPQCVRYSFRREDIPALADVIAQVYAGVQQA